MTLRPSTGPTKKIQWPHNGVRYGGPNDTAHKKLTDRLPDRLKNSLDSDHVVKSGAETRAAVALLSRSIRIVSAGLEVGEDFHREATGYSYGAHMVIRPDLQRREMGPDDQRPLHLWLRRAAAQSSGGNAAALVLQELLYLGDALVSGSTKRRNASTPASMRPMPPLTPTGSRRKSSRQSMTTTTQTPALAVGATRSAPVHRWSVPVPKCE